MPINTTPDLCVVIYKGVQFELDLKYLSYLGLTIDDYLYYYFETHKPKSQERNTSCRISTNGKGPKTLRYYEIQ